MTISINAELKSLIRPLTEDESEKLEAAILRDGIREPLSVWQHEGKLVLLDGHNRKRICDKHGLEYKTKNVSKVTIDSQSLELDSLDRAKIWVAHNQAARRNLDASGWSFVVATIMPAFSADARRRQVESGEKNGAANAHKVKGLEDKCLPNKFGSHSENKINESKHLGEATVRAIKSICPGETNEKYVRAVLKEGGYDPKTQEFKKPEKLAKLETKIAQSDKTKSVVADLIKQQKQDNNAPLIAKAKKAAEEAPGQATIYHETCEQFLQRFAKGSVNLLLTDPLYMTDVDDINKFAKEWLPTALSKLMDTGRGFVFIGAYPEELRAYLNTSLPEQVLVWTYNNTIGPMPKKNHFQNWQAVLYYKGKNAPEWNETQIKNVFSSQTHNAPDGRLGPKYYTWEKPIELVKQIIARSTEQGDTIIDPFAGSGTHLLAGKLLGRTAFGCDYEKKVVKIAVDRGCSLGGKG